MNKIIFFIVGLIFFIISGCASSPFNPQVGMTLKDVSSASNIACLPGGKSQYDNLEFIRFHPYSKEISEYKIKYDLKHSKKFQDYMDSKEPGCRQSLFFYENKLISNEKIELLIAPKLAEEREKEKKIEEEKQKKIKLYDIAQKQILEQNLTLLDYFTESDDFKIYKNKDGKLMYINNNIFVSKDEVSNEILAYERRINYIKELNAKVKMSEEQTARENRAKREQKENEDRAMRERIESIRAKQKLASNDVISKALNYINGLKEDSSSSSFYARIENNNGFCRYELTQATIFGELFNQAIGQQLNIFQGLLGANLRKDSIIYVNRGDPKSLQIFEKKGLNEYRQPYLIYISKIEGVGEFQCDSGVCNPDRLKRAWNTVYSQCKGAKKDF